MQRPDPTSGSPRRLRSPWLRVGRQRGRSLLAMALAVTLLFAVIGIGWWGFAKVRGFFATPDYVTSGSAPEVTIEIKNQATLADMAEVLKAADVIKSEQAFVEASERNSRALNIQPGFYRLRTRMSGVDAVAALLDLRNRVVTGVLVREGLTSLRVFQSLSKELNISVEDFKRAAKDPVALGVPQWWFERTDGKPVAASVEGFLFPARYEFPPDVTAESALRLMIERFLSVAAEMNFVETVQAERGGISPYEALIVASLAQAEAGTGADLPKVARVAYNRLFKKSPDVPCQCLEMDVTVNYWLESQGKPTKASKDMTAEELDDPGNPYNRRLKGFPPTPINNPGQAALAGAMQPTAGDWFFFVAIDGQGNSAFARTIAEHEKNVRLACERKIVC